MNIGGQFVGDFDRQRLTRFDSRQKPGQGPTIATGELCDELARFHDFTSSEGGGEKLALEFPTPGVIIL